MERFKTVIESETIFTELMVPGYANFGDKVHGGIILSIMDKVAYATAVKHCEGYVVTIGVDAVEFHKPVEIGNLLTLKSRVNYVGKTSMIVGIRAESTHIKTGEITHSNTAFFTMNMKSVNENDRVPGLILQSQDDIRRFAEGLYMKQIGSEKRKTLKSDFSGKSQDEIIQQIINERMQIIP
jgi:acyl-CoA hydrolase